ncbi:MAG: hypothetical protein WB681_00715 [Candidatus Cybelea sp.]
MKRERFLKQVATIAALSQIPLSLALGSEQPIITDVEMQLGDAASMFAPLFRGALTPALLSRALRSSGTAFIRVAQKPGCVGIGWRYEGEIERNVAEIDVRAGAWKSEADLIAYARTFFLESSVKALRMIGGTSGGQ